MTMLGLRTTVFLLSAMLAGGALAQGYPNKPIKFVVPFPPGGNLDFVARNLQPKMQEVLGQPVIIDNKGGNAGMIGLEFASKQPGDGYTIVLGNTGTSPSTSPSTRRCPTTRSRTSSRSASPPPTR
jgi:tripartite-type tricarboxylate transporter receptor subunit TctC